MIDLVSGWTERIRYELRADGSVVDLTGATVTLLAHDSERNPLTLGGTAGISSPEDGEVFFDPLGDDLVATRSPYSPMYVRFQVIDQAGKVSFWPSSDLEKWRVWTP